MDVFFFFNDTPTPEIYTLSLHDALPISPRAGPRRWTPAGTGSTPRTAPDIRTCAGPGRRPRGPRTRPPRSGPGDRKSTRLNSSHANISYAVFCLKKKNISVHHYFDYSVL